MSGIFDSWVVSDSFWTTLNAIFGALLGASFYVLVKTQPYLLNRSYDPKFNGSYISRFVIGVIGGLILSIALGPFLTTKLGDGLNTSLSPGVLALIGGYSAEAVELVLQRVSDILVTAVRGDGSTDAKTKLTANVASKDSSVCAALDKAIDAHNSGDPPDQVKVLLKNARDEANKPVKT